MIECDLDPHPVVYRTYLMVLSAITPLLDAYAIFCIVKKSPKQMATYKWWLLCNQIVSSVFDFVFSTLISPVLYFPIMMMIADSYLARWISLSIVDGIRIFGCCIVVLLCSTVNLFIYRCYVLIPQNHILKVCLRGPWIYAIVLFVCFVPTFIALCLIDFVPDQIQAKIKVLEEFSCAKTVMDVPGVTIFTRERVYHIFIIGVTLDFFGAALALCAISLSRHFLNSTKNQMSQKTKLMQRRYLFSLYIQVSIPAITLFTPVCAFLIGWYLLSFPIGQGVGNLGMSMAALHCPIAPLCLIFCNDTYRKYTVTKLRHVFTMRMRRSARNDIAPPPSATSTIKQ